MSKRVLLQLICTVLIAVSAGGAINAVAATVSRQLQADIVYTNAKVYTVNDKQPWAEAFAVKGNRFVAVGPQKAVSRYIGNTTKVVDLGGKLVLPGLVEEHVHPDMAAENLMNIHLLPSEMSWEQQAAKIKAYAAANPGKGWLMGGTLNWLKDNGEEIMDSGVPSHHSTLDALVPHRPIMLWDIGGHAVLLNKKGLEILKITAATPNPEGGVIVKDSRGEPTGVLRELAAHIAYEAALEDQPRGRALIDQGLRPVFDTLNQFGFTAISDVWARYYVIDAYKMMAENNELNLRVKTFVADPIEWTTQAWKQGAQRVIDNHRDYYVENWLSADGVKFVLDGSAGGQTIIMVEPYEGTHDVHGGPWRNDPDYFHQKLLEYDAKGITVKAHAVGSQTIRTVLDAVEAARQRGSKLRHNVAHTVFVHPEDRPRFKALNVVAEFSPYFWYPTPSWEMVKAELGERRMNWTYPFKTIAEMGVPISVGSDWPVAESPNPFPEIESMITRQFPGGSAETLSSHDERVSLETAIKAFTLGGAYAQNREHIIGSIEMDKLADFIVLDKNLFEIETRQIHTAQVEMTVVDGRTVYQR